MTERRIDWKIALGFVCWAILRGFGEDRLAAAMNGQRFAILLTDGIASIAMLGWALRHDYELADRRGWSALLLLLTINLAGLGLWRPYVDDVFHLHYAKSAQQMLLLIAAPLWLALLGALRWVPEATPRRTAGAALAGIAAVTLLLREDDLTLVAASIPVLVLTAIQAIAMVWAWSYAKRSLVGVRPTAAAGCGLLLSATLNGAMSLFAERPQWQPVDWRSAGMSLIYGIIVAGVAGVLWYWLLQRMELAAFTMQTLAVSLSGVVLQFVVFGFLSWRVDLAMALGSGALVVALRASLEDDEPVLLHVG